jgi:hypothetical protein
MIKKTLITLSLFASLGIYAQDVTTYTPNTLDEGIVYFLPKTHLKVIVTANKATYTPGELCQYAERYLKLQGVSAQPKEYWEIQDIFVVPIGVPDTNKVYAIKLKDKMVTSKVELTEDGIIKAINTTNPVQQINDIPLQNIQSERIDPRNFMTEEMLMSGSTGKMAELIAKEIYNIRESKNSLTRGQADYMPQDGAALKIMLENLDKQEKDELNDVLDDLENKLDEIKKDETMTEQEKTEAKEDAVKDAQDKIDEALKQEEQKRVAEYERKNNQDSSKTK